jgi:hypothetical protein
VSPGSSHLRTYKLTVKLSYFMISDRTTGIGFVMEASDAHGDGGCSAGDPRTKEEVLTG